MSSKWFYNKIYIKYFRGHLGVILRLISKIQIFIFLYVSKCFLFVSYIKKFIPKANFLIIINKIQLKTI